MQTTCARTCTVRNTYYIRRCICEITCPLLTYALITIFSPFSRALEESINVTALGSHPDEYGRIPMNDYSRSDPVATFLMWSTHWDPLLAFSKPQRASHPLTFARCNEPTNFECQHWIVWHRLSPSYCGNFTSGRKGGTGIPGVQPCNWFSSRSRFCRYLHIACCTWRKMVRRSEWPMSSNYSCERRRTLTNDFFLLLFLFFFLISFLPSFIYFFSFFFLYYPHLFLCLSLS